MLFGIRLWLLKLKNESIKRTINKISVSLSIG